MLELGRWKDWLLRPLRARFAAAPEPWQARPPPQVEPQFRHDVTQAQEGSEAQEISPLSTAELKLLGLPADYGRHIEPYEMDDSDGSLVFLDWEDLAGTRRAVFRVRDDREALGCRFARLRYSQVQFAGQITGLFSRPDEDLKALRAFHARFGEPSEDDLKKAYEALGIADPEGPLPQRG